MLGDSKKSGILLHPTSLPGAYGIGEIGPQAYQFVDELVEMGQKYWQILPLGPTDDSNSPYSALSTFAGNHLLISMELLVQDGLLEEEELTAYPQLIDTHVDFETLIPAKMAVLDQVCLSFDKRASRQMIAGFEEFAIKNKYWLDDYALFRTLKKNNDQRSWINWDEKSQYNSIDISLLNQKYFDLIKQEIILQYLFHDQWFRLREYCKNSSIEIIGDMPIYVDHDSADVWANPQLFKLDPNGGMAVQSGCPPCNLYENGQVWGNPLYQWENHLENGFIWWKNRFNKLFEMVDVIRIDHFIGFSKYWQISTDNSIAKKGEWLKSPGHELFSAVFGKGESKRIIAEDLGDLTPDVIALRDEFKFPGMIILQIAFFGENGDPKKYPANSVVYTGTHDNNTIQGWFRSLPQNDRVNSVLHQEQVLEHLNMNAKELHWEFIQLALNSRSKLSIFPVQDLMGLDETTRFNIPGTNSKKNWQWRHQDSMLTSQIKERLKSFVIDAGRL